MGLWRLRMLCVVVLLAATCRAALYFAECTGGSLDVVETTNRSFLCAGYSANQLNWTVTDIKGDTLYSGVCNYHTCGPPNDRFTITAKQTTTGYSSWLTIKGITRDSGLTLRCNTLYITKECKLKVIVPVRIVPESCSVEMSGWSVSGWCTLEWMNNHTMPTCTWRLLYQNKIQSLQGSTNSVRYDSQDYKRVNCSFVHKIPAEDGNYTYSINISSHPADQYSESFKIEKPNNLKHNCPETVLEGSSINCRCYASRKGNPPAEIAWDGSKTQNLVINNVMRKNNGAVGVCRLTWGDMNITTLYTINISFTMEQNEKSASGAGVQGGLIGGVVTAVVIIAVMVAVVIVHIMKRRKKAGESGRKRSIMGFSPHLRENLHGTTRLSTPYSVVNKPKTETPVEHHASPSDDLYTNACTTKADTSKDEYATICKTMDNKTLNKEGDGNDQVKDASHEASQMEDTVEPTIKLQSPIPEATYMNLTEFPTDSGLGVYHIVPYARNDGSSTLDANIYSPAITPDNEYNVLHFEKDRTELEDQFSPYNHLEH